MAEQYHVVVHRPLAPSDLGVMTEVELYGYVRTRSYGGIDAAEALLWSQKKKVRPRSTLKIQATRRFGLRFVGYELPRSPMPNWCMITPFLRLTSPFGG
jgi:hypothetical protein